VHAIVVQLPSLPKVFWLQIPAQFLINGHRHKCVVGSVIKLFWLQSLGLPVGAGQAPVLVQCIVQVSFGELSQSLRFVACHYAEEAQIQCAGHAYSIVVRKFHGILLGCHAHFDHGIVLEKLPQILGYLFHMAQSE